MGRTNVHLGADETLTLAGVSNLQISYQTHEGRQLSKDAQGGGIFFLARFQADSTPGVAHVNWRTGAASILSLLQGSDS